MSTRSGFGVTVNRWRVGCAVGLALLILPISAVHAEVVVTGWGDPTITEFDPETPPLTLSGAMTRTPGRV